MTQETMTQDLAASIAACASAVEAELTARLGASDTPPRLLAAMRHAVLSGGKRLRPYLVAQAAALFGVDDDRSVVAGAALEALHCYSLVHDDLPAMDNDATRRGQPTVHIAYDEATAILAGDALLTHAFEWLGDAACDPDPEVRIALVAGLAKAAGAAGMVGGQMLDLAAEGRFATDARPLDHDAAMILHLQSLKTGALFSFAVDAGALLGRADAPSRAALARYGEALGRAFQIADDILDAVGDACVVGKATGKDAAAGKATLVGLMGLAGARDALDAAVRDGDAALAPFGARAQRLIEVLHFVAARDR